MNRRGFLLTLGAGLAAVLGARRGQGSEPETPPAPALPVLQEGTPELTPPAGGPPALVSALPGQGQYIALTVDDGTNADVVAAYAELAKATGLRLTFFVTASYQSWTQHAGLLRPLVDSGQIQLANHTWSHPALTKISAARVAEEVGRCESFLNNTYGVSGRPFLRPPFGYHNATTAQICADLGYSTQTMWLGTLGDSGTVTAAELMDLARKWLQPQSVVIGHANQPTVIEVFGQLIDLLRERALTTVTLNDAFFGPQGRARAV